MRISDWSSDVCSSDLIQARRHELSTWFNQAASATSWTDGPIAAPTSYTEYAGCYNAAADQWTASDPANVCPAGFEPQWGDLAMAGAYNATRNENKSQIGRAHVRTPVTNAHIVCRLLLEKKNNRETQKHI